MSGVHILDILAARAGLLYLRSEPFPHPAPGGSFRLVPDG